MLENLEEDATNILEFMASNGLVANPNKTEFMLLNNKDNETIRIINSRNGRDPRNRECKTSWYHNGQ